MPWRPLHAIAALALWLSAAVVADADCPIQFHDVTKESGITFRHTDGSSGKRYIVEYVSAGLATFDYDGDGRNDIYFLNGRPLRGTPTTGTPPRNALWRNLGNWKFADMTRQAGVDGGEGHGLGIAIGDYQNDGHPDIYLNNFGPNVLYRNNGDGTFSDVTRKTGVGNGDKVGAGVCFLDVDKDGQLDLFVANYVDFTYDKHRVRYQMGRPKYASPLDYEPTSNTLYRNLGNGFFADISAPSGIAAHRGKGMGTICADYDNDGNTDIFVANDVMSNFLFHNDGKGKFDEVGLVAGVAYDFSGNSHGNMGVECADYDHDGLLDFYVTAFQHEPATLFRNLGQGMFQDITLASGAGEGTVSNVSWGCGLVDFDNDGHRDIFLARGHLDDNVQQFDDTTFYEAKNFVLRNTGDGRFVNVSEQAGDGMQVKLSSRGAAFDDLDNDGDIDVVVLNSRREPTVLRNMLYELGSKHHWLQLRLRGVKTNRDGVGARVKVVAGDLVQIDEVHSGRSYQSHFASRLHFGLGSRDQVDRVEVQWPGSGAETFIRPAADRLVTLVEGSAQPASQRTRRD